MSKGCCGVLAAVIVVWTLLGVLVSKAFFYAPLIAVALVRVLIEGKHG
ncbi:hypothetical protein [Streptomyces hesseae]|uniref:Uncharacterized protein n=1 Tax=Streptomyces hesseae TaxID=3075519 RepID=A0ABU2SWI7_9ACTN|nr:hypothetical protein [Streptomyces sp. DSM 40473]MDT0452390.1 hypothetical protein [Streptomyces sp. DSM 40473]